MQRVSATVETSPMPFISLASAAASLLIGPAPAVSLDIESVVVRFTILKVPLILISFINKSDFSFSIILKPI